MRKILIVVIVVAIGFIVYIGYQFFNPQFLDLAVEVDEDSLKALQDKYDINIPKKEDMKKQYLLSASDYQYIDATLSQDEASAFIQAYLSTKLPVNDLQATIESNHMKLSMMATISKENLNDFGINIPFIDQNEVSLILDIVKEDGDFIISNMQVNSLPVFQEVVTTMNKELYDLLVSSGIEGLEFNNNALHIQGNMPTTYAIIDESI